MVTHTEPPVTRRDIAEYYGVSYAAVVRCTSEADFPNAIGKIKEGQRGQPAMMYESGAVRHWVEKYRKHWKGAVK